jgi:hypothetical protein
MLAVSVLYLRGCTTYLRNAPRVSCTLAVYQAEFCNIWQAAVAAATNSVLNSLPAFGGRRADKAWLAQQLQDRTAAGAAALEPGQLLTPVLAGAEKLLQQQQEAGATADAAGSSKPAGWLLLGKLCDALQSAYNTPNAPTQQLQPLTAGVMALLVQHTSLPMPAALPGMLCAAAKAAAARGDVSVYKTAVQHARQLQLSSTDLAAVTSAALAGAAAAAAQRTDTGATYALRQLWPSVLQSAGNDQSSKGCLTDDAAAAVVAAVAANTVVADLLLGDAALPLPLLVQLLQAAVDSKHSSAVQQLLAHSEQHQLLQQLPPTLLLAAVGRSSSADAAARIEYAQQAVELLLQQGQAPDAAAAPFCCQAQQQQRMSGSSCWPGFNSNAALHQHLQHMGCCVTCC